MSEIDAENTGQTEESEGIKQLRARAEKASDLERKVAEYERRDAFREAGIDLKDPKTSYFVKGYDGELSPEAIRAKAIEDGFLADAEAQARNAELGTVNRIDQASSGGVPPPAGDFEAELAAATNETEVLKVVAKYQPNLLPSL